MNNASIFTILKYHQLTDEHLNIIFNHKWIDGRFDKFDRIIWPENSIYCSKCKIAFGYVLYKYQRQDGTKWHELTCDEVMIKKLLE